MSVWQCANHALDTSTPLVMGILNVTPDSFSDGGRYDGFEAACVHAQRMVEQGATIIDVGGESTRPGSDEVSIEEELARVLPVVTRLVAEGLIVSIDTRHAAVAQACVLAGAVIINDISGFRDQTMVEVAASCDAGLVVMHMLGEPKTMQTDPYYQDVVKEVCDYLCGQARMLERAGVAHERICVDPGPGFGKTFEHNLALLRQTATLALLGYPLMAAYSRKGFVGALTGVEAAAKRVAGSVTVALYAAAHGARILRVHDVAPTTQALKTLEVVSLNSRSARRALVALGSNVG
ncbi:MAG: dihydropteroate synthase, partial [Coriobacteriales bacterium]|nr:dihydropteroate synthase [Coriobacteriales bacterium]